MKLLIALFSVFAVCQAVNIVQQKSVVPQLSDFLPDTLDERGCLTEEIWKWRQAVLLANSTHPYTLEYNKRNGNALASCPTEGSCDQASVRNAASTTQTINVPCRWILFQTSKGVDPISRSEIDAQMDSIYKDFAVYNMNLYLDPTTPVVSVWNSKYASLPAYGSPGDNWYYDILDEKQQYASDPENVLNIFVNSQTSGQAGTLLGMGTFPWDPQANTATGGLWMNKLAIGSGRKTLNHEVGHNLGLWHTFHGVSEVTQCSACWENPDMEDSVQGDTVGDFCADTPPTPRNFNCAAPGGYSPCDGESWGTTMFNNIMGYAPDNCLDTLTDSQEKRMICWMCNLNPSLAGCV